MQRGFNHLDGSVVADFDGRVDGEGHLREAECARVGVLGRADELDAVEHGVGHVRGHGAETHVDVDVGGGVALEPARLEGDGAAFYGPFGAVGGGREAAA